MAAARSPTAPPNDPARRAPSIDIAAADPAADRLVALRSIAPETFSETGIDFDKLRLALGGAVDEGKERYGLTWAGKAQSVRQLMVPARGTLAPVEEESVNFDTTQHVFIEGENLEVLKLLRKSYAGRVKMIYIDPPYNTGKDFIYPDNFADPLGDYLKKTEQVDEEGNWSSSVTDADGRKHSKWLSMIYPRLLAARDLLRDDGFVVVSIDDAELSNLRSVMDEVFGEENRIAVLVWDRNRKNDAKFFSVGHEYMVVYSRNRAWLRANRVMLRATKEGIDEVKTEFERLRKLHKDNWRKVKKDMKAFFDALEEDDPRHDLARFNKFDAKGPFRDDGNINWPGGGGPRYIVLHPKTKKPCKIPVSGWRYPTKKRFDQEVAKGRIVFGPDETTVPSVRTNLFDNDTKVMQSVNYSYAQTASQQFDAIFGGKRVFDNPKPFGDLAQMVSYLTDADGIVLDFFAGSASLGHGVWEANNKDGTARRFVCVQVAEPIDDATNAGKNALRLGLKTIADISRGRLRRVSKAYAVESNGTLPMGEADDIGFRSFRIRESHYKRWVGVSDADAQKYVETMALYTDPLVPGWMAEDLLWEVALKEGYALHSRIERIKECSQNKVYKVTDPDRFVATGGESQSFYACFDPKLAKATIAALKLTRDITLIVRDGALTDTLAANLALTCTLKTI